MTGDAEQDGELQTMIKDEQQQLAAQVPDLWTLSTCD